jgi:hypothetical protein
MQYMRFEVVCHCWQQMNMNILEFISFNIQIFITV